MMKTSNSFRSSTLCTFVLAYLLICIACSPKEEDPTPITPTPETQKDIAVIDAKINTFLTTHKIPGASLAISKNGKLVYKKGYGKADVEGNVPMTSEHRMRVGSVTKTFTGVAAMRLLQQGKLRLDDKVFGDGAILGNTYGSKGYSDRVKSVTVRHLLQMTTGGFVLANDSDPININQTLDNTAFFNYVMDNSSLKYDPGTRYWYINTNYFIAARVLEKISGKSHFQFLKDEILTPLAINSAAIGKPTLAGRFTDEPKYYAQGSTAGFEYTLNMDRRDGSGALVISAADLLKFLLAVDGDPSRPDILDAATYQTFTQASGPAPLSPNFGCGVLKSNSRMSFFGSMPGARAGYMIENNGMGVVVTFNGNVDYSDASLNNAFAQAHQALLVDLITNNLTVYQNIDQF